MNKLLLVTRMEALLQYPKQDHASSSKCRCFSAVGLRYPPAITGITDRSAAMPSLLVMTRERFWIGGYNDKLDEDERVR